MSVHCRYSLTSFDTDSTLIAVIYRKVPWRMLLVFWTIAVLAVGWAGWCLHQLQRRQAQLDKAQKALQTAMRETQTLKDDRRNQETDREATENRLRGYLQLMDTLVNTIPNPIYFKDINGVYQGCNNMYAQRILGLTRDRIIGRRPEELTEIIPAELAAIYRGHEYKAMQNRGFHSFEAQVRCADGITRDYLFSMAPIRDGSDKPRGCVSVLVDLTEKNRAAQVRLQKEKLEGVLETAGAVCHELNQPLQALSGWTDMLSLSDELDPTAREYVGKIHEQIGRISLITAKLQGITRYETMLYADRTKIIDIHKSSTPAGV